VSGTVGAANAALPLALPVSLPWNDESNTLAARHADGVE